MLAVVAVPSLKAPPRLGERVVGLFGGLTGVVKRLPQVGNLRWPTVLQGGVDLPGITTGGGNQLVQAYVSELHRGTSRNVLALSSSITVNADAA
jgi:hypothetical protein